MDRRNQLESLEGLRCDVSRGRLIVQLRDTPEGHALRFRGEMAEEYEFVLEQQLMQFANLRCRDEQVREGEVGSFNRVVVRHVVAVLLAIQFEHGDGNWSWRMTSLCPSLRQRLHDGQGKVTGLRGAAESAWCNKRSAHWRVNTP